MIIRTIDSSISEKAEYFLSVPRSVMFLLSFSTPKLVIGEELLLKNITPPPHDSRQFF
jgi:hypothetical protein